MSPEGCCATGRASTARRPSDLRANLGDSTTALPSSMKLKGDEASPPLRQGASRRWRCTYSGKPALQTPALSDGSFEVGRASQLLGFLLQPSVARWSCDFCAGAGGEPAARRADAQHRTPPVRLRRVSDKRLSKLKPRVARSGLSNIHPVVIAGENDPRRSSAWPARSTGCWSDAPCSNLGTLRRNPDLKWRQAPRPWPNSPQSGRRSGQRGAPRQTGRPSGVCHLQPAAEENEGHRRRLPGRQSGLRAGERRGGAGQTGHRHRLRRATPPEPRRPRTRTASSPRCWAPGPDAAGHSAGAAGLLAASAVNAPSAQPEARRAGAIVTKPAQGGVESPSRPGTTRRRSSRPSPRPGASLVRPMFPSKPIARALADAHRRGVRVSAIDAEMNRPSSSACCRSSWRRHPGCGGGPLQHRPQQR